MHRKNLRLIDKKYVHKHKDENVLIWDVRKMLPRRIDRDVFEKNVLKYSTGEERHYLLKFYVFCDSCSKPCYVLRTSTIEVKNYIKRFLDSEQPNNENRKYLQELFNSFSFKNAESRGCILNDEDSEIVETKILHILGLRGLHINDLDRMTIYDVLKNFESITWRNDIFFSRMHVDTNHSFFFEHPNEHLPGLMLIEAIRQFGIACSHKFINVPLAGVQFALSDIKINFNGYLELNYPIKFEGRLNSTRYNKSGCLTYVDFGTTVYQNNEPLVYSSTIGKYLPNELFNIVRRNIQGYNQPSRFIPRQRALINCLLKNNENRKFNVDLMNVSRSGFCVRSSDRLIKSEIDGFELVTPLGNIGRGDGRCDLIWQKELDDGIYSDFKINYLDESDDEILAQALKIFCYVDEDEAIL